MLYEMTLNGIRKDENLFEMIKKNKENCEVCVKCGRCDSDVLKRWRKYFAKNKDQLFKVLMEQYGWRNGYATVGIKKYEKRKFHSKTLDKDFIIYEFDLPRLKHLKFMAEHGCGYVTVGKSWIPIENLIMGFCTMDTTEYIHVVELRKHKRNRR